MSCAHQRRCGSAVLSAIAIVAALGASGCGDGEADIPMADPRYVIEWATLLGGDADEEIRELVVDDDGTILIGGVSNSSDFPTTEGAFQRVFKGEPAGTGPKGIFGGDCFVSRLTPDGSRLIFSTYFGGSRQERSIYGMELAPGGDIVFTTTTRSRDLPTTEGALQRRYGGGPADVMVTRMSPDGRQVRWCTYIGGRGDETPRGGLDVDGEGNVYIVGSTKSADFPAPEGDFTTRPLGGGDAFLTKLAADGSRILGAYRFGGKSHEAALSVRIGDDGTVHVLGQTKSDGFPTTEGAAFRRHRGGTDLFLAGFSSDARRLLHATFIGGRGEEYPEHNLRLLPDGSVMVTGYTDSPDFPTTPGACQSRVRGGGDGLYAHLSAGAGKLLAATVLGGSATDFFLQPTPTPTGDVFLVGITKSPDFPVTPDAYQHRYGGGDGDGAIALLSADGKRLLYATYLGGRGSELIRSISVGADGSLIVVGATTSKDFPTTRGVVQSEMVGEGDAFVVKLRPATP